MRFYVIKTGQSHMAQDRFQTPPDPKRFKPKMLPVFLGGALAVDVSRSSKLSLVSHDVHGTQGCDVPR